MTHGPTSQRGRREASPPLRGRRSEEKKPSTPFWQDREFGPNRRSRRSQRGRGAAGARGTPSERIASAKLVEGVQHHLVRRPHAVVDVDELPSHHPAAVDDERGGMRPAPTLGVQQTIAIDDTVAGVLEERKSEDEGRWRRGRSVGVAGPRRVGFRQIAQDLP